MPSVFQINGMADLFEAVNHVQETWNSSPEIWWRGHAIESWPLTPSLFRSDSLNESNIIEHFVLRAQSRHENCPATHEYSSWLFLMQHYGLPTRLLDWTRSPLVAAYFAVEQEQKTNAALWALWPGWLNQTVHKEPFIYTPRDHPATLLFADAFKGLPTNEFPVIGILPDEVDPRLLIQQSTFTIHGTRDQSLEDIEFTGNPFLLKFDISSGAKQGIQKELQACGITEAYLFPDLEHLAKDIVRQEQFDRTWASKKKGK